MSSTYLHMWIDTRYLFLLIRFKYRSLFFNRRFFGESGCKDTTFFQYAKIFFQKIPFRHADSVVLQRYASEKKFHPPRFSAPQNGAARAKKGENPFLVAEIGHQKGKSAIYHYSSICYPHTLAPRGASYQQSIPLGAATVPLRHFTAVLQ